MTYRCKAIQLFRKAIASFQEPGTATKAIVPADNKNPKPRKSANIAGDPKPQTDSQHYGRSTMSYDQGSALVASCYLLMGQSQYLGDGIQDFMTLTRGSASLRAEMMRLGFPPLFQNLEPEDSVETMCKQLQGSPPFDKPWISFGQTSLETLQFICVEGWHLAYLANLENTLQYCKTDTFKMYTSIMDHFIWWTSLPFEDFQRIIDMTDQVNILLATHWVALIMAMSFLRKASMIINDDSKRKAQHCDEGKARRERAGKGEGPVHGAVVLLARVHESLDQRRLPQV